MPMSQFVRTESANMSLEKKNILIVKHKISLIPTDHWTWTYKKPSKHRESKSENKKSPSEKPRWRPR